MTSKTRKTYQNSDFRTGTEKAAELRAIVETGTSFDRSDIVLVCAMQDAFATQNARGWADYYGTLDQHQKSMFVMVASSVLSADNLREIMEGVFEVSVKMKAKAIIEKDREAYLEALSENSAAVIKAQRELVDAQNELKSVENKNDELRRINEWQANRIATLEEANHQYRADAQDFSQKYEEAVGELNAITNALHLIGTIMTK